VKEVRGEMRRVHLIQQPLVGAQSSIDLGLHSCYIILFDCYGECCAGYDRWKVCG
jgi:hypothetical protein